MEKIREYFLGAQPWQLCLMMIAPYAIYKFSGFGHVPFDWGVLAFYFLAVVLGWIYSIGSTANEKLNPEFQMNALVFKTALILPFICLFVFLWGILFPLSRGEIQVLPSWGIYVHFTGIISFAYSVWFSAKQFTTLKLKQEISFIDYYGPFMGLWFGFIGVWFLQPQVQQLLGEE